MRCQYSGAQQVHRRRTTSPRSRRAILSRYTVAQIMAIFLVTRWRTMTRRRNYAVSSWARRLWCTTRRRTMFPLRTCVRTLTRGWWNTWWRERWTRIRLSIKVRSPTTETVSSNGSLWMPRRLRMDYHIDRDPRVDRLGPPTRVSKWRRVKR